MGLASSSVSLIVAAHSYPVCTDHRLLPQRKATLGTDPMGGLGCSNLHGGRFAVHCRVGFIVVRR